MEMLDLLVAVIYLLLGVVGWFLKGAIDSAEDTKAQLAEFRVEVAQHYAHKNDLRDLIKGINERFDRIENKIDRLMESR